MFLYLGFTGHQCLLALAATYFLYALAHTGIEIAGVREQPMMKMIRRTCHIILIVATYAFAGLYVLEYVLTPTA